MAPALHVRQRADGALIAGSDFGGSEPGENSEDTARALFDTLRNMIADGHALSFGGYAVGRRPMPRDGVSIIGRLPQLDGVYVTVTHSGITLAPALSAFGAAEILTGERDALLRHFGPDRFATA